MQPYPPQSEEFTFIPSGSERSDVIRFRFLPTLQFSTVERLVLELPLDKQLGFYDADYPSPSDPGAYFSVAHGKNGLLLFCGNHGWSSYWQIFETFTIIRFLWGCRDFNGAGDVGGLSVTPNDYPCRPVSQEKNSYFARNVARRVESML